MTEEEIHKICEQYNIENYKINPDMSIDVDGNVPWSFNNFSELPVHFNRVAFEFDCHAGGLTTLKGCPNYVGTDFYCSNNSLTTLNELPINFYVGGDFYCGGNNITDFKEYGKIFFIVIQGHIYTGYTKLDYFFNKNKNPPKKDLPRLLSELRKFTL